MPKSINEFLVDTVRLDSCMHLPFHAPFYIFCLSLMSSMVMLPLFSFTILHAKHAWSWAARAGERQELPTTSTETAALASSPAARPGFTFPESWQAGELLHLVTFCQWLMTEITQAEYPELLSLVYLKNEYVWWFPKRMYTTHAPVCWGDVWNTIFVTGYFSSKPLSVFRYCPFIFIKTISQFEFLTRLHLSM